jgi:hypothetical protein
LAERSILEKIAIKMSPSTFPSSSSSPNSNSTSDSSSLPTLTDDDSDEEIDWEEWKPNQISFYHHMIAGSIAGLAEHITLFPVDTIKTNLQCQKCGSISPFNCATRMIRNEGVFRLWRGVTATFTGCIPGKTNVKLIFSFSLY